MEESQRQEAVAKIRAERSFLGHPRVSAFCVSAM